MLSAEHWTLDIGLDNCYTRVHPKTSRQWQLSWTRQVSPSPPIGKVVASADANKEVLMHFVNVTASGSLGQAWFEPGRDSGWNIQMRLKVNTTWKTPSLESPESPEAEEKNIMCITCSTRQILPRPGGVHRETGIKAQLLGLRLLGRSRRQVEYVYFTTWMRCGLVTWIG